MAMAETLQSKLSPMAPAARIPRGPVYSLTLDLVALLGSSGEVSIYALRSPNIGSFRVLWKEIISQIEFKNVQVGYRSRSFWLHPRLEMSSLYPMLSKVNSRPEAQFYYVDLARCIMLFWRD